MKLLEKVLVPVDVNTDTTALIDATIKLANTFKSEIILIYVVGDMELSNNVKNLVLKSATVSLNEIKEVLINNSLKVREPEVVFGKIVETIILKANSEEVNLLLIGSKEKKKRKKFKLGVIAEQIIRESDVPVWLVTGEKKPMYSNILCPVDFSEPSKRALANAILIARKFNAQLKILNVYEPLEFVSHRIDIDLKEENETRLRKARIEMEAFINEFHLEGVVHNIEIKRGKADEKILDVIRKQQIDLLIMGTNGRTGLSRFFMGSVTEKVIREMPCSFITIKEIDVIQLRPDHLVK